MLYNVYAGLGGGFGGATYQGTGDFPNEEQAAQEAYRIAREEYESYEGLHGILGFEEVADENDLDLEEDDDLIRELYEDEVESWIEYWAVLADEDEDVTEEERCDL